MAYDSAHEVRSGLYSGGVGRSKYGEDDTRVAREESGNLHFVRGNHLSKEIKWMNVLDSYVCHACGSCDGDCLCPPEEGCTAGKCLECGERAVVSVGTLIDLFNQTKSEFDTNDLSLVDSSELLEEDDEEYDQ